MPFLLSLERKNRVDAHTACVCIHNEIHLIQPTQLDGETGHRLSNPTGGDPSRNRLHDQQSAFIIYLFIFFFLLPVNVTSALYFSHDAHPSDGWPILLQSFVLDGWTDGCEGWTCCHVFVMMLDSSSSPMTK